MKALYEKLYQDYNNNEEYREYVKLCQDANIRRCCKNSIQFEKLSHFVSMKGTQFDTSDVRLFVVGRAANGWKSLECKTAQMFGDEADQEFSKVGFQWIEGIEDNFQSLHNKPKAGEKPYYLSSSPFWRVVSNIWCGLSNSNNRGEFINHIAWSNLYKISPEKGGNPTDKMCGWQFKACYKILEAEIKAYRPTHILMITDYKRWFAPQNDYSFKGLFDDPKPLGSNYENKDIFVEGTAKFELGGRMIPVVITCRPEGRNEGKFVKEVLDFLRDDRNT